MISVDCYLSEARAALAVLLFGLVTTSHVDVKVAKAAKMSKLRGQRGQVGHVEEVVDFGGYYPTWPRWPSYFEFFRRIRNHGEYFACDHEAVEPRITRITRIPIGWV